MQKRGTHKDIHSTSGGKYLKSLVYGGLDGIITTFAVVAGVVGANLSSAVILILGFANLIGDGISMAFGDYLSTKSQGEYYKTEKNVEKTEAAKNPKAEKSEMKSILVKKGFKKVDAEKISFLISKNRNYQADTMLHNELGIIYDHVHPERNALVTFFSFLTFGVIPLILFVFGLIFKVKIANAFLWASILSGVSMFLLGVFKSKITKKNWLESGVVTLVVGGIAATAAYFVGDFLSRIV